MCSKKRPYTTTYDLSLHTFCSRRSAQYGDLNAASFRELAGNDPPEGSRPERDLSLKKDAEIWSRRIESEIDTGKTPTKKNVDGIKTFKGLIALHISDMKEVGKKIGRSKEYSLKLIA